MVSRHHREAPHDRAAASQRALSRRLPLGAGRTSWRASGMAQMRQGRWTFSSPALAHDPMRQRVQFHQKAQAQGQAQSGRRGRGEHIPSHMCHPLIRGEGKAARSRSSSSLGLDPGERKALAQPASPQRAEPASAQVAQPAFSPESRKHPQQRVRTALAGKGEGFVSLRHERKMLKASSCGNAAGNNEERNIT
jgi:hypothetical protein